MVRQPLPASRGLELYYLEKLEADSRWVTRRLAARRERRPEARQAGPAHRPPCPQLQAQQASLEGHFLSVFYNC